MPPQFVQHLLIPVARVLACPEVAALQRLASASPAVSRQRKAEPPTAKRAVPIPITPPTRRALRGVKRAWDGSELRAAPSHHRSWPLPLTGWDEPKNWDEFFGWCGSLPGYVVSPDDPPIHFVRRFTPGNPHGARFLVIGAANPFAAVHDAARKWGDAGEGRVTRLPGRAGRQPPLRAASAGEADPPL